MVPLPEETSYLVRWGYVKDGSGRSDADAGWIDEVRVEGAGYGDIALNEPEPRGTDGTRLSWATIPCRHYQVFLRPKDTDGQWRPRIAKVEPSTGLSAGLMNGVNVRETRVPRHVARAAVLHPDAAIARVRADPGQTDLLGIRSGGSVPFRFRWYFRAAGANSPQRALAAGTESRSIRIRESGVRN